jgi:uncharacterized repeat protein (TIGR01451 family)
MPRSLLTSSVLRAAIFVAFAGAASAQQTPSNTLVTNTIALEYNSGAGTPTVSVAEAASASFRVDRKIDLLVSAQTSSGLRITAPGVATVVLPFFVRNLGNDTEGYVLDITKTPGAPSPLGLTFAAAAPNVGEYALALAQTYDAGTFDVATASFHTPGTAAFDIDPNLPSNEGWYVLIVANVPIGAADEEFDTFTVTALVATAPGGETVRDTETRNADPMEVSVIFADAASNSTRTGGQIDAAFNGKDADETRLQVNAPILSATKTATVVDEGRSNYNCANKTGTALVGNPAGFVPGACVEYTITLENTSTSGTAATGIQIDDAIPASTTYFGNTAGDFTLTTTGSPVASVRATLATLPAGEDASFSIRVKID